MLTESYFGNTVESSDGPSHRKKKFANLRTEPGHGAEAQWVRAQAALLGDQVWLLVPTSGAHKASTSTSKDPSALSCPPVGICSFAHIVTHKHACN